MLLMNQIPKGRFNRCNLSAEETANLLGINCKNRHSVWMSHYNPQINKTTTSAMRREGSYVIIPCYHKRSARLEYNLLP